MLFFFLKKNRARKYDHPKIKLCFDFVLKFKLRRRKQKKTEFCAGEPVKKERGEKRKKRSKRGAEMTNLV